MQSAVNRARRHPLRRLPQPNRRQPPRPPPRTHSGPGPCGPPRAPSPTRSAQLYETDRPPHPPTPSRVAAATPTPSNPVAAEAGASLLQAARHLHPGQDRWRHRRVHTTPCASIAARSSARSAGVHCVVLCRHAAGVPARSRGRHAAPSACRRGHTPAPHSPAVTLTLGSRSSSRHRKARPATSPKSVLHVPELDVSPKVLGEGVRTPHRTGCNDGHVVVVNQGGDRAASLIRHDDSGDTPVAVEQTAARVAVEQTAAREPRHRDRELSHHTPVLVKPLVCRPPATDKARVHQHRAGTVGRQLPRESRRPYPTRLSTTGGRSTPTACR